MVAPGKQQRNNELKIAFTTSGAALDAPLDGRFGRAPRFLIYDLDADTFEVINNEQNLNAAQGAGIQSAQTITQSGAKAIITGHCGPKAFRALRAAGVAIYNADAPTISAALDQYRNGELVESDDADVEGHWI